MININSRRPALYTRTAQERVVSHPASHLGDDFIKPLQINTYVCYIGINKDFEFSPQNTMLAVIHVLLLVHTFSYIDK